MPHEFGFTFCSALRRDKCYVAGVAIELEDRDVPHAILFEEQGEGWERWSFAHRLAGIASHRAGGVDTLITVGIDGFVESVDAEGADEEQITAGELGLTPGGGQLAHAEGRLIVCGNERVRAFDGVRWTELEPA